MSLLTHLRLTQSTIVYHQGNLSDRHQVEWKLQANVASVQTDLDNAKAALKKHQNETTLYVQQNVTPAQSLALTLVGRRTALDQQKKVRFVALFLLLTLA